MFPTSQQIHPIFLSVVILVLIRITLIYGANNSLAQSSDIPSQGHISFETYRMLFTGMTEAEVLGRAGQPAHLYYGNCDDEKKMLNKMLGRSNWQCWTYYYDDGWIAQLSFESRRVVKIETFKLP